jgi:hypothetical protein
MRRTTGRTGAECMEVLFGRPMDAKAWALVHQKEEIYRELFAPVFAEVAGFKAFCADAMARGLRIGVGTAGDKHNIAFAFSHLRMDPMPHAVVGGDEGLAGKPEPAIFLEAARRIGALRRTASCSRTRRSASRPPAAPACARWPCAPATRPSSSPARMCWPAPATTTNSSQPIFWGTSMPHLLDGQGQTVSVQRLDYQPPAYWIDTVDLTFDLDPAKTRVLNRMRVRRNPDVPAQALRLDGEELNLARVLVNGSGTSFRIDGNKLVLENLPAGDDAAFDLEIFTTCAPAKNTKLMGLYVSNGSFFTQCEAEGFRRITYFLDRPDVMASYSVTLRADKALYPVLLSNGNLVEQGDLQGDGNAGPAFRALGRPAPQALLPVRAGRRAAGLPQQRITSRAGRDHLLEIYVRRGDLDKTEHAMQSLMASIAWDEARFGLSLDLERFMIVATSDFNMGAMENKGLNIFNTKYVLASQATATDTDFSGIESVVGHEYFHNWTGNRVTCRDWFQLSLKEGLTVFRDQEFSQDLCADASARAVKRIEDVRVLRTVQFPEDAGPMAHPVRPDSYQEINNFYTVTVYEKGAEVVRMMQTLVGREGFARGMKLYFERHDGQAVTCDDFAQAQADANPGSDLAAAAAVQALVQPGRHAAAAGARPLRRRPHLHADAGAELRAHARAGPQGALRDPAEPGPGRPRRTRPAAAAGRRVPARRRLAHLRDQPGQRDADLHERRRRTGALAAARLQRAGRAALRLHRRAAAAPAGARQRPVQPLGSRPAAGDARDAAG